jgi:peptidyl-prolyl cis-trans isomerase A (cyclophilin A)
MYRLLLLFFLCILLNACKQSTTGNPHVEIKTRFGDIELELYAKQAPQTVTAFISYIDSGFYKRSSFYRVMNQDNQVIDSWKAELVQGGLWRTDYKRATTLKGVAHETTAQTNIKHTNGVISLARMEPGTATTEFFICVGDQPGFDFGGANNPDGQGYAAFGKVVKGANVLKRIYNQPERNQAFDPPVHIFNIVRK